MEGKIREREEEREGKKRWRVGRRERERKVDDVKCVSILPVLSNLQVYRSLKYRYEVEGAAPVSPHYLLHIYIHHMVFSTCCKVFVW